MNNFLQALLTPEVPFIRYALIAGIISSIPFGIIGSYVVVKRMSYIAGAVSHAVLGGIGIALFLSTTFQITFLTPMVGAFIFALAAGLILSFTINNGNQRLDTVIGAIWAIGMSVGLLFMALTPGYTEPMSYLFGNILLIGKFDLWVILGLNGVIIIFSVLFFDQLLAISFDKEFATIRGINTAAFQTMLILLISITVLLMITIVGIVMVIALLTIPPAISGLFTKKLKPMMTLSIWICAFIVTLGLITSYLLELPSSSITIILLGVLYLVSLGIKKIQK